MGLSHGTGQPLTLRCGKCKVHRQWDSRRWGYEPDKGMNLVATGRTKPRRDGRGGARINAVFVEYRCLDCGHVGWTKHIHGRDLLAQLAKAGQPVV
jgi:hypothetical protein